MQIEIDTVPHEKKHILRNMLELYFHDMSEFDDEEDRLELNDAGLYGYKYLDYYWTQEGRFAYIVTVDGHLAGLSLIRTCEMTPVTFEVAEFFILKKYRKTGVGTALIARLFTLHKGHWVIDTAIKNTVAQNFWRNCVINANSSGFEEHLIENGRRLQWIFKNTD
jgi:predicted acetyltransferase